MVSQKVVIKNPTGLHLRPAGILCKEAMQFKSLITFTFRGNTANAKSVLSVLGACVKSGDEIEIICDGEDEAKALETLIILVGLFWPPTIFLGPGPCSGKLPPKRRTGRAASRGKTTPARFLILSALTFRLPVRLP